MDRSADRPAPKPGAGRPGRARGAKPLDLGRLTRAETHATSMFELLPPDPDDSPALETAAAYLRWGNAGRGAASGVGPTIELARMLRNTTWEVEPSRPAVQAAARLVYVLRWEGVGWATSGPPPANGQPARNHEAIGRRTVIVDADTGETVQEEVAGTTPRRVV